MFDRRYTYVTLFKRDDKGKIIKDEKGNKVIRQIVKIEEFTIYNQWKFSNLQENRKLSLLFPEETFRPDEEKEIFSAIEKVNKPVDFTGGKKGKKTSVTEAITYLCETSNEKRFDILHNWTKAQAFFWVNESINFRSKSSSKNKNNISKEEFAEAIKAASEGKEAIIKSDEEKLRKLFQGKWNKTDEQMKRYTLKDLKNAYRKYLKEGGEKIEQ